MITKTQIDNWLSRAQNRDGGDVPYEFGDNDLPLIRFLEGKILVDRWNYLATDIILHSDQKDKIRSKLKTHTDFIISSSADDIDQVWGTNIHYSDYCPNNTGIIIDQIADNLLPVNGKHIAIFPI